eukprot:SAG31_NODE_28272_length_412_cov_1.329073_1_plen_23_part_10
MDKVEDDTQMDGRTDHSDPPGIR